MACIGSPFVFESFLLLGIIFLLVLGGGYAIFKKSFAVEGIWE